MNEVSDGGIFPVIKLDFSQRHELRRERDNSRRCHPRDKDNKTMNERKFMDRYSCESRVLLFSLSFDSFPPPPPAVLSSSMEKRNNANVSSPPLLVVFLEMTSLFIDRIHSQDVE